MIMMEERRLMLLIAAVSGILCALFYLLHDVIGAMNYPGYDPMRQAVSDLTATDAPSFAAAIGYSSVYGILSILCCVLICLVVREEAKGIRIGVYLFTAMQFVSAIGYSLFPLTGSGYDGSLQSFVHVYILTVLVVVLSIASLVALSYCGIKNGRKVLGIAAAIALIAMMFGAIGSQALPQDVFGLVERFSTYSAVVFTAFLGFYWYRVSDEGRPVSQIN